MPIESPATCESVAQHPSDVDALPHENGYRLNGWSMLVMVAFLFAGIAAAGGIDVGNHDFSSLPSRQPAVWRTLQPAPIPAAPAPTTTTEAESLEPTAAPATPPLQDERTTRRNHAPQSIVSSCDSQLQETPIITQLSSWTSTPRSADSLRHTAQVSQVVWHANATAVQENEADLPTRWSGFVTPIRRAQVPARDSGVLVKMLIDTGKEVASGETLGELDRTRQLRAAQVATAEFELAQARASHRAARELAMVDALQQETAYLETSGGASASNRVAQEETQLRRLLLSPRRETLELQRLTQLDREFELEAALKQIEVEQADEEVARGTILAPWSGMVTQQFRQQGEWVIAGEAICELVSFETLRVELSLPVAQAQRQLLNRTCEIEVEGLGGDTHRFDGRIARIGDLIDANYEVRVEVRFDNRREAGGWAAVPGSRAQVSLND